MEIPIMEIGDKLLEIKWEIQIEKEIYLLEVSPVEAAVVRRREAGDLEIARDFDDELLKQRLR